MSLRDRYWFNAKKGEAHESVWKTIQGMEEELTDRTERFRLYLGLYENCKYNGLRPGEAKILTNMLASTSGSAQKPMTLNVIQSCTDTLASKIASQHPRPQFLTDGGQYSLREQARELEKFVEGVFYAENVYQEARRVFIDAAIFGTGVLKVFEDEGKVCVERVFPDEVVVDEQACLTSPPRSMFQVKEVPAELLIGLFPKHEAKILEAMDRSDSATRFEGQEIVTTDLIRVVEAWHKPSSPKAKDGRHVITIATEDLHDEPWEGEFPFVVLRWSMRPIGWYGQGLAEQLENIQREINTLIQRVQQAMHLYAVTNTYVEKGTVNKGQMKNTSGNIVEVEPGVVNWPKTYTPPPMSAQVFEHLWTLYSRAYEIAGISQMSATSKKPAGVESGIALRTLLDTETQRFGLLARDWEEFFVSTARQVVRCAKKVHKQEGSFKAKYVARDFVESIDFAEVDIDEDAFVLKVYPTNFLPQTPAGKLAYVQELMASQMVDPQTALTLLDFPDIERFHSLESAAADDIDRVCELILTKKQWIEPLPYMDKKLAASRVTRELLRAHINGVPEDRMEMLENWLEKCLEPSIPPPPPAAQPETAGQMMGGLPPGMGPGGPPGLPPISLGEDNPAPEPGLPAPPIPPA